MDEKSRNVVPFRRTPVSREDSEAIETIMHVVSGGEDVPIASMEITKEPMNSICHRLSLEQGVQITERHAWRFPVKQWRFKSHGGEQITITIIDQGDYRIFWNHIEQR